MIFFKKEKHFLIFFLKKILFLKNPFFSVFLQISQKNSLFSDVSSRFFIDFNNGFSNNMKSFAPVFCVLVLGA